MAATMSSNVLEEKNAIENLQEEALLTREEPDGGTTADEPAVLTAASVDDRGSSQEREPTPSLEEGARGASPAVSEGSSPGEEPRLQPEETDVTEKRKAGTASGRSKKREDKGIEHVLRALNSLETTEEKLAALCKKYTDLLEEHRVTQSQAKQNQRKLSVLSREKEQLQSEHSKAVLAKSKLESLCRELQRHNKLVKEESLARAREEEEKRKEVTTKFQSTINDIQTQMNDHYQKNTKLREENVELANKLKSLIEQYELREQHIEKVFKHKELEQQLVDAKLAQASLQITEAKEHGLQEKQMLLTEATEAQKKVLALEEQETQLRAQVALYTEKYEEFQGTLAKSNEVFGSFKVEMDKMTKKIKKLEKETTMWRSRWENSNKALLEMAEEKTHSDKEIARLQNKVQKLESLCRALQVERNQMSVGGTGEAGGGASTEGAEQAGAAAQGSSSDTPTRDISPTKTPPNTPEESARTSPVTVQAADSTSSQSEPSSLADSSQSEPPLHQSCDGKGQSENGIQPEEGSTGPSTSEETESLGITESGDVPHQNSASGE